MLLVFSFAWIEFYMYAITSKNVLEMPFLYRTAFPFRLFIGPILFLYVRNVIFPPTKFSFKDAIHLIVPTILVLLIMPEFLISNEEKRQHFEQFYKNESIFIKIHTGIMPAGLMQPLTSTIAMLYCFWTIYYVLRTFSNYLPEYRQNKRSSIHWIYSITYVTTIFNGLQFVQFLFLKESETFSSMVQILQSCSLIFLKGHFLTSPENLQMQNINIITIPQKENKGIAHQNRSIYLQNPPYQSSEEFRLMIDKYMLERKPFLNSDFDLEKMSDDLKLNKRKISKYLKTNTGMNFNEIVNRYRINYFLELIKTQASRSIKTESLIKECGFSHKSTFYSSFQRIMKDSPNNYLATYIESEEAFKNASFEENLPTTFQ